MKKRFHIFFILLIYSIYSIYSVSLWKHQIPRHQRGFARFHGAAASAYKELGAEDWYSKNVPGQRKWWMWLDGLYMEYDGIDHGIL